MVNTFGRWGWDWGGGQEDFNILSYILSSWKRDVLADYLWIYEQKELEVKAPEL